MGDGGGSIISGNALAGIAISGMFGDVSKSLSATINDNRIGTDPTGTLDFGNGGDGVSIAAKVCSNIFVSTGGDGNSARNLISGNHGPGITISGIQHGRGRVQTREQKTEESMLIRLHGKLGFSCHF